jgi:starch-binding outer membrane protein SusE/F
MKKINHFICLLLMLCVVVSCSEDSNMDPVGNWELVGATLIAPANNASVVLNDALPASKIRFEWNAALATNRFLVKYEVVLVPAGSSDYDNPLYKMTPGNGGKDVSAEITAQQLDYILWTACYAAGEKVELEWAVLAKAIDKVTVTKQAVSFTRFEAEYMPETLFLTGTATEVGDDVTNAVAMRSRTNAAGNPTYVFDVYTTLTEGGTYQFRDQAVSLSKAYGGGEGALEGCGAAITAPETGVYRVTANLNTNTYSLLKIDKWSLVGDAVQGGWDGDVPLAYKGNGVWEGKISFVNNADFIFRPNGDWAYGMKRIKGTATANNKGGKVIMESEQSAAGVEVENVPSTATGKHTVTLDLSAEGYTYSVVPEPTKTIIGDTEFPNNDAVNGEFEIGIYAIPNELYLVSGGAAVATLTKDGTSFKSNGYLALEQSKKYILNSASNGSGTTYNTAGNGEISVARNQAYQLTVNFATGKLSWKYYNMKLFHWDEVGGGWDNREELVMTYVHPRTFEVTDVLTAGFHSKFNSPWEVQFGTNSTALTGTMTNGGTNFTGITQSGSYKATIVVAADYSTCEYTFVKQ